MTDVWFTLAVGAVILAGAAFVADHWKRPHVEVHADDQLGESNAR